MPDILTDTEVIEVKNVARLTLTPQLRDFALSAATSGRRFVLVTRFDTVLAPDLQALVDGGKLSTDTSRARCRLRVGGSSDE